MASIYINRYAVLFALKQKYIGYDIQEIVLKVIKSLRKIKQFFFIKDLQTTHIFEESTVMAHRVNRARHPLKTRLFHLICRCI